MKRIYCVISLFLLLLPCLLRGEESFSHFDRLASDSSTIVASVNDIKCLNGFISFNPASFTENKFISPVIITGFRLFNKEIPIGGKNSPLKQSISDTKEIILKYNQSSFSIDFAALSYTASEKNMYACMLKGFDKEWTTLSGSHSATYSNLPPGDYVFQVKSCPFICWIPKKHIHLPGYIHF